MDLFWSIYPHLIEVTMAAIIGYFVHTKHYGTAVFFYAISINIFVKV